MKRTFVFVFGLITMLSSCSSLNKLSKSELELNGTKWTYTDDSHEWSYELIFLENGQIQTTHPNDASPENDFWKQDKTFVEFSFNDGYSVYTGERTSSNQITGEAQNSNGKKWKWVLTKL